MCVILDLKPNQMPIWEEFENAVYNNPHGYGVVLHTGSKMEVIKDCPEGGNDPKVIYEILKKNKELQRYLHLRYNTVGDTSLENTHPFSVISSKKNTSVFMHNGTLSDYNNTSYTTNTYYRGNSYFDNNKWEEGDKRSDTLRFVEEFLTPLMASWNGTTEDPLFRKVLNSEWSSASKGLLISDKEPCLFLGTWVNTKDTEGKELRVSNIQYFSELKRGPEFEKRKKEALKTKQVAIATTNITKFNKVYKGLDLSDVTSCIELYEDDNLSALNNLTITELENLYKNKEEFLTLFCFAISEFENIYSNYQKTLTKKIKNEKHLEKYISTYGKDILKEVEDQAA